MRREVKPHNEMIQALEKGADANEYDDGGFRNRALSTLFYACRGSSAAENKKRKELVLCLLSQDHIDLDNKSEYGDTLIIQALEFYSWYFGDLAVFEKMLEIGEDPNRVQLREHVLH